jgi:hypothetical protein
MKQTAAQLFGALCGKVKIKELRLTIAVDFFLIAETHNRSALYKRHIYFLHPIAIRSDQNGAEKNSSLNYSWPYQYFIKLLSKVGS